jgi:FkbM family methyltransferase
MQKGFWHDCLDLSEILRDSRFNNDPCLGNECLVLDVGANVGLCSLQLAKEGHEVIAFEPEPSNIRLLYGSIRLNQLESQLHVVPMAVLDRDEQVVQLIMDEINSGGHCIECSKSVDKVIEVQGISLDSFFDQVGYHRIHLLKLDVEGAELPALRGAHRLLSEGLIDLIVYEVTPNRKGSQEAQDIWNLLRSYGYTVFYGPWDHSKWILLEEAKSLSELVDIDSNLLAVRSYTP